jgi:predicted AlkP superfamily phosphohydrolase/phosphomutase/predicted negative regulator of RcsB-dependent stress response
LKNNTKRKILLVGWDAADWKFINPLMDEGRMPHLSSIVDQGVIANLASLKPCLSPILWTSIATGKTADKHGILGFVEPDPKGNVRLSTSTSRKVKALWNILSQSAYRSVVINWYASHPAEPIDGCVISNRFFEGLPDDPSQPWQVISGSVHPPSLGEVVSGFRMHPAELTRSDLARFIPQIEQLDLQSDPRPALLAKELAKTVSIHSVATGAMQAEPWDFMAVYYDGLDTIGHRFMPYHPPRMSHVSERDFVVYQHVMRELYLFHDELLGRLLELAGSDATVVLLSDHGFHCDHLRPQQFMDDQPEEALAAAWHRHYGVLAMRGPDLLKDERVYGATLLDIAPTVLTMCGLPVAKDMDGKPLVQAFQAPGPKLEATESWENLPGNCGMHPPDAAQVMTESSEALAQLVALGYLSAETLDAEQSVELVQAESNFNLAIVHSSNGRHQEALDIFRGLFDKHPSNSRYGMALAKTHANLQQHDQCLEMISRIEAMGYRSADSEMLAAAELFNSGRIDEANTRLDRYRNQFPVGSYFYTLLGNIYVRQSQWQAAREAFTTAVQLDSDDPHNHFHLSMVANRLGLFEEAAEHALQAIGTLYFFPQAHYQLGVAFKGLGDIPRATRSLNLAVSQAPQFLDAHRELATIYDHTNNTGLWLKHQRLSRGLSPDH